MFEVLKLGISTTVQAKKRYHCVSFGVPIGGAMDSYSAGMANLLLENKLDAALLEITMSGPKLKFHNSCVISLCGADFHVKINGKLINNNKAYQISKGDELAYGFPKKGLRGYLAVKEGINSKEVLGSRSFYKNITKYEKLEKGNLIHVTKLENISLKNRKTHLRLNQSLFNKKELEVFEGPEYQLLPNSLKEKLNQNSFHISALFNRMAYQLSEPLANNLPSLITSPVLPGTVQLTPSGKLIVLMRDAQLTGGYPRIFQLSESAINILSQKREGQAVKFVLT